MENFAIILNNNRVEKVKNFQRKYERYKSNPQIKILEECTKEQLEDRYNHWLELYKTESDDEEIINPVYHHVYKNPINGWTIYSTLEEIIDHEGYELIK